jgi:hypothetical protein
MSTFSDLTPDNTISGGTTGASIGNNGDRLKVDANIESTSLQQPSYDAFGRIRTSSVHVMFESSFRYDLQLELWSSITTNGATVSHESNKCAVVLATTSTVGSSAIYQTRGYFKYGPARSSIVFMSFNLKGSVPGQTKRIGQFDALNGYFLELSGGTAYVVIRSKISGSVVDTKIAQADWNIDKLNGTGESGITIDFTKQNILEFDYQWLGSGSVRFGFSIGGVAYICHRFSNANINETMYSQTATLPMRVEISTQTSSSSTIEFACCSVGIEGEQINQGQLRNVSSGEAVSNFSESGDRRSILSIRKKSTNLEIPVVDINTSVFPNSSDKFLVELVKNGTVTGGTWVDVSGFCQVNRTSTDFSGGLALTASYVAGGSGAVNSSGLLNLREALNTSLGSDLSGNSEIFSIVVTALSNTSSIFGSMNYKELS